MMEDNLLHNYYAVALGMNETPPQMDRYIQPLSHKYSSLVYLDIGAGTVGATYNCPPGTQWRGRTQIPAYEPLDIHGYFDEFL